MTSSPWQYASPYQLQSEKNIKEVRILKKITFFLCFSLSCPEDSIRYILSLPVLEPAVFTDPDKPAVLESLHNAAVTDSLADILAVSAGLENKTNVTNLSNLSFDQPF